MRQRQILLSGDYWHPDFKNVLSNLDALITMIPQEKLDNLVSPADQFDLIIFAESRRGQIQQATVESLRERFAGIPMVSLLGSWCEGELRSGDPIVGLNRVYWHQWQGRFDKFIEQLQLNQAGEWHLPATATVGDRVESCSTPTSDIKEIIGVSAWTQTQFEMVSDSLRTLGYQSRWLERSIWDAEAIQLLAAICVDANSMSDDLVNRLRWLKSTFPRSPLVLILNFPRSDEVRTAEEIGVTEVLSKPFALADLLTALIRASRTNQKHGSNTIIK